MLKSLFDNPISRTFIALILALIPVLIAFTLYVTSPISFGTPNLNLRPSTVYYFADEWNLTFDYLELSVPKDSLVVPGYNNGHVNAVLIVAPEDDTGSFILRLPAEHRGELPATVSSGLDQALILIDNNDFNSIVRDSGDTILLRSEDTAVLNQYLKTQLAQANNLLVNYESFGYTNYVLPTPSTVLLQIWTQRMGLVTYYEDQQVHVSGLDFEVDFPHPTLQNSFYPPAGFPGRVLVYSLLTWVSAMAMIAFVAGGVDIPNLKVKGEYNPLWTMGSILTALVYAWAINIYEAHFFPHYSWLAVLWLLPLGLVGMWVYHSRLPLSYLGLSRVNLAHALFIAPLVGLFVTLASTTRVPVAINWSTSLFLSVTIAMLFREAFLRGFCQRVLSHWISPWVGVVAVSLVWALFTTATGFEGWNNQLVSLLFVSRFAQSMLIGYSYHRTHNIIAPGLLAAVMELAPLILVF